VNAPTQTAASVVATEIFDAAPAAQPVQVIQQQQAARLPVAAPEGLRPGSPAHLLMIAVERGANMEYLERLIKLQEQMEANEARRAYNDAFAAFKGEVVEILKTKKVKFPTRGQDGQPGSPVEYRHAELSGVIEAAGPALSKHGFSWSWVPKQTKDWVEVTCILKHRMGYSETATLGGPPDNSGKKNALQQVTSTITFLQRATLKAVAGLSEKGDDDDGRGGRAPNKAPDDDAEPTEEELAALNALVDEGQAHAVNGMKPLTEWWGKLTNAQRTELTDDFKGMRKVATDADALAKKRPAAAP
jgi:hypothetical protein